MNRRTLITILIAVLVAVVIGALWLWFFRGVGTAPAPQTGSFGTGQTRNTGTTGASTTPTNIPSSIGQTTSTGGSVTQSGIYVSGITGGGAGTTTGAAAVPGVSWLAGGAGGISGGSGTAFNPSTINQLNNGQVGGSVNVLGTFTTPGGSSSGGGGLGIGGSAAIIAGTAVACTAFLLGGAAGMFTSSSFVAVQVNAPTDNNKKFMDCIARTIARAAIQQITASVVNWINSGFNGKPSFVTNYQSFFANVADQAAGEFIKTQTNFAPYCTPFRTQIQIALAQSYARRNNAQSCTLSTLLSGTGINLFGKNTGGTTGWGNFISFTTVPSNNPYGSYMSAQAQLQSTLLQANQNANRNISTGGFLNFQQPYDCQATVPQAGETAGTNGGGGAGGSINFGGSSQNYGYSCPSNCKCKITTPGGIIESSLSKTLSVSQDTLTQAGISGSFDAIISALISQLMTRALQGGVSNLSGTSGYASYYLTADQQAAQTNGQGLLTQLQGLVVMAQQFGQNKQGSAQDIQNAQSQLNGLANCWQTAASSTALTDTKQNIAFNNAQNALATLRSYDGQIDSINGQITRANAAVALLQDLQTRTLGVGSTAEVSAIQNALAAAEARGGIIGQADITTAAQDRTTLQSQLNSLSRTVDSQLSQCYAFQ